MPEPCSACRIMPHRFRSCSWRGHVGGLVRDDWIDAAVFALFPLTATLTLILYAVAMIGEGAAVACAWLAQSLDHGRLPLRAIFTGRMANARTDRLAPKQEPGNG